MEEKLREFAEELRKVAELIDQREELDPEKVRDFLIFFGGGQSNDKQ